MFTRVVGLSVWLQLAHPQYSPQPLPLPSVRYGIRCADNHTGTLPQFYLNRTRIYDPQALHILEINLAENNLTGTLPASIGQFQFLKYVCACV